MAGSTSFIISITASHEVWMTTAAKLKKELFLNGKEYHKQIESKFRKLQGWQYEGVHQFYQPQYAYNLCLQPIPMIYDTLVRL